MSSTGRFLAHRGAVVGALLVAGVVLVALVGPFVTRDPLARDIDHGLTAFGAPIGPSSNALLGTDALGRDVLARVVAGAGTSLVIALLATAIALGVGVSVGLLAGFAGGRIDNLLMRVVDLAMVFPVIVLAILLAALLRAADLANANAPVVLTLGAVSWTTMARVIRGKTASIMRSEHVVAARALGAAPREIVRRHVLPNVIGVVLVVAAIGFAQNLLAESVLSYVGLGPAPPAPTWGRMVFEGRGYYRSAPHLVVVPGLALVLAVVAFNVLAEGLRVVLDPKARV